MRKTKQCPKCGSKALQEGTIYSHGAAQFLANVRKGLLTNILPPQSDLAATACLTCGYVELYLKRLDKLTQMLNKVQDGNATPSGGALLDLDLTEK